MNDAEVMTKIIKWMISEVSSGEYIEKLKTILKGVEGKKYIEENMHPRFQSIVMFGMNVFPFTMEQYRQMSEFIKE